MPPGPPKPETPPVLPPTAALAQILTGSWEAMSTRACLACSGFVSKVMTSADAMSGRNSKADVDLPNQREKRRHRAARPRGRAGSIPASNPRPKCCPSPSQMNETIDYLDNSNYTNNEDAVEDF